ncbi:MAG: PepSY domain-containing protein [Giesbergeria sp.]
MMKHTHPLRPALLALAMGLAALPTWADDDCDAPVARWQSREAVRQMAAQQGWDVQRLKIDDGCYEVYGKDAQGRSFKAKVDPETLRVVKIKRRDHDRDGDRARNHRTDRAAPPASDGAAPVPAPASSPVFAPGTAPRGQVE